jgi:hypothetical protein
VGRALACDEDQLAEQNCAPEVPHTKIAGAHGAPAISYHAVFSRLAKERATGLEPATSSLGRRAVYGPTFDATTILDGSTSRTPRYKTVSPFWKTGFVDPWWTLVPQRLRATTKLVGERREAAERCEDVTCRCGSLRPGNDSALLTSAGSAEVETVTPPGLRRSGASLVERGLDAVVNEVGIFTPAEMALLGELTPRPCGDRGAAPA